MIRTAVIPSESAGTRTALNLQAPEIPPPALQAALAPIAAVLPVLALVTVAVIWGVAFTVVDGSTTSLPPADLVAWRFGIAAVLLAPIKRSGPAMTGHLRIRAIVLGALLGAGFLLQAVALTYTDALMSGFLTSLLVVVAPIAGWVLFRERLRPAACAGVILAGVGLGLLSLGETGIGPGELLTIGSAALWGLHVVLLSRWSRPEHALGLARIQTTTVAVMALVSIAICAGCTGRNPWPTLPVDGRSWLAVLFLAVLATAAAMVLLSWSQSRITATRTAVILTLEPAVAGLTAALLGAELTGRTLLGAGLLLAAMCIVESGGLRPSRRRSPALARPASHCRPPSPVVEIPGR